MKKSVKGIIGLSAVLVVLGGSYAALMLTQPDENIDENSVSEISDTEQQNIMLIYDGNVSGTDPDTGADLKGIVETVGIKNESGEIHVVQNVSESASSGVNYTIDGYQDIEMQTSVIGTLANNINGLTSADVIEENCTDKAKFGLDSPSVTVDVKYETGTEYTLYIGNAAPTGSVTYVMLEGGNTVYTVNNSTIANYSKSVNEFINKTILQSPDETPIVNSFRIERQDIDYDILLEYDSSTDDSVFKGGTSATHIMKEPVETYLSVEKSNNIITGMFGLSAEDIYAVHCTDSDIAEAGLEDSFCTVTMECNDGNNYKLLLSEPFNESDNGKCCYAMLDGGNVIFTVAVENAPWITVQPVDISSTTFIASYVWSIDNMKITTGDNEYLFEISQNDPNAELTSPKSTDFNITLNGNDFESERYRLFYAFLIKGTAEDLAFSEVIPSGEPMATVEYNDYYNSKSYTLDFYEYSNTQAIIAVNGESKYFISKSYVETLIENAAKLESDEDFTNTWR